jgi:DNA mismatch repair protein MutS
VGVKTLFATHYHELTELALTRPRVKNFNIAVKEWNDDIIFLRKLVEGGTNRSYGIQVARLAGIPEQVIRRAKTILADIEREAHAFRDTPGDSQANGGDPRQVQLGLFPNPADDLVEWLRRVDIAQTTPLEALQLLNDMQARIKRMPD